MNKKVLFLGCNFDQLPYLEVLLKKELQIFGVDINPQAPGKDSCHKFYNFGYDNLEKLLELGKKESFTNEDKIFTAASQFALKGASHFASKFHISFPPEESIDICLDKTKFYDSFRLNGIPFPKTFKVSNLDELKKTISQFYDKWFYLKSDFSKNPFYVYRINSSSVPWQKIEWKKDRYFRNYYVLQEEFVGDPLRINIYGNRFNVFNFMTNKKTKKHNKKLNSLRVIDKLIKFRNFHKMNNWLLKFDIIFRNQEFVVLDVGMDPPSRMIANSRQNNIDFEEHYVNQYLEGEINYPMILD